MTGERDLLHYDMRTMKARTFQIKFICELYLVRIDCLANQRPCCHVRVPTRALLSFPGSLDLV